MNKPKIVTLCGSTRFTDEFAKQQLKETLVNGNIVLTIGCNIRDTELFKNLDEKALRHIKARLDVLHFRKIDISDEILVLNVGDYIGESTEREIEYAKSIGVSIRYLEPHTEKVTAPLIQEELS